MRVCSVFSLSSIEHPFDAQSYKIIDLALITLLLEILFLCNEEHEFIKQINIVRIRFSLKLSFVKGIELWYNVNTWNVDYLVSTLSIK